MSWIQTYTGKAFFPLSPEKDRIDIEDIAHSLAHQCRFAGHCLKYYSVAEHSVLVSLAVSPPVAMWGLLHDASKAYLVDVPRPLKHLMPQYMEVERAVMREVARKWGLPEEMPAEVKEADRRILFNEKESIMSKPEREWSSKGEPLPGVKVVGLSPSRAKGLFLQRFHELTGADA